MITEGYIAILIRKLRLIVYENNFECLGGCLGGKTYDKGEINKKGDCLLWLLIFDTIDSLRGNVLIPKSKALWNTKNGWLFPFYWLELLN